MVKAAAPLIGAFLIVAIAQRWPADVRAWVFKVTGRRPLNGQTQAAPPASAPEVGPDPGAYPPGWPRYT